MINSFHRPSAGVEKRGVLSSPVLTVRSVLLGTAFLLAVQPAAWAAQDKLRTLIVGGGPNPASNQVAIESNVRYVTKLLPEKHVTSTLFADGDKNSRTVIFRPEGAKQGPAEQILEALLRNPTQARRRPPAPANNGQPAAPAPVAPVFQFNSPPQPAPEAGQGTVTQVAAPAPVPAAPVSTAPAPAAPAGAAPAPAHQHAADVPTSTGNFKAPDIKQLDGPSKKDFIETAFARLSGEKRQDSPIFLYFTGHGSQTKENPENNYYNLWSGGKFTVQDLAVQIARLPEDDPVVLVMVQCFSGSFANVLFENGDPKAPQVKRDIVGFFASTKDRVAAGCTPAVNEEYYYDFTSYFFSALTGRDRLDRKSGANADFDRNGKVGLDEAFYWAIINDNSIDVPVATSDVFLERFSPLEGDSWQETPYSTLLQWASPAQKAALEGLSQSLNVTGEKRILDIKNLDFDARAKEVRDLLAPVNQRLQTIRQEKRTTYLAAFPALSTPTAEGYAEARKQALARIETEIKAGEWQAFLDVTAERNKIQSRNSESTIGKARQLRFLRVAQKVVRDHNLRAGNDTALKERYFNLLRSEGCTLLPYKGERLRQASIVSRSGNS